MLCAVRSLLLRPVGGVAHMALTVCTYDLAVLYKHWTQLSVCWAAAGDVLGVLLYLDTHPEQLHNRTIFQSEVPALPRCASSTAQPACRAAPPLADRPALALCCARSSTAPLSLSNKLHCFLLARS